MANNPEPYLEYLDKEMTIMGLLSAFCVALASLATEKVITAESGFLQLTWCVASDHVIAGAAAALAAAFLFYLQRSRLAWHYGQIALAQSRGDASAETVDACLVAADGWDSWVRYKAGFGALVFSFIYFAWAIADASQTFTQSFPGWLMLPPLPLAGAILAAYWRAVTKYPHHRHPFREWCKAGGPL